jgi:hypothetical protein
MKKTISFLIISTLILSLFGQRITLDSVYLKPTISSSAKWVSSKNVVNQKMLTDSLANKVRYTGSLTADKIIVGAGTNGVDTVNISVTGVGNIIMPNTGTQIFYNNIPTNSTTNNAISLVNTTPAIPSLTTLQSPSIMLMNNTYASTGGTSIPQYWRILSEGLTSSSGSSSLKMLNSSDGVTFASKFSLTAAGTIAITGAFNSNSYISSTLGSVNTYPSSAIALSQFNIVQSAATAGTPLKYGSYNNRSTAYFGGTAYTYNWRQTVDPISASEDYLNLEYFADGGTVYMPYRFGRTGNYKLLGNYDYALSTPMTGGVAPTPATNDKADMSDANYLKRWYNYEGGNFIGKISLSNAGSILLTGQVTNSLSLLRHTTTNTAGNNLTINAGGATIGATNKDGGILYLQPGLSTGTAKSSVRMQRTTRAVSTGTTDNTLVDAYIVPSVLYAASESTINLFEVALPANTACGGLITFQIVATDGTDFQVHSGHANYASVNKGGIYTSQITDEPNTDDANANTSGTLSDTWAITEGTNKITISVAVSCSVITANNIKIYYSIHNGSSQAITQL